MKIAAYLLNPLKNDYAYEDIAKDYLDLMVPSKEDYFGKKDFVTSSEEKPEEFLKMACYQAYINLMAKEPLAKQLEEEGMKELFDKIEMPLVYTLSDMEKEGIAIDADALKEYGENLAVSIDKIEKEIYEEAGETFNINSPKQLGVILFENCRCQMARRPRPDILLQQMYWKSWHRIIRLYQKY